MRDVPPPRDRRLKAADDAATIHPTALVDAGRRARRRRRSRRVLGRRRRRARRRRHASIGPHAVVDGAHDASARATASSSSRRSARSRRTASTAASRRRPRIGDDNVVREYVTIHAGTAQDRGDTTIGNGNWFLAYTHVAHDCVVGDHTTFSNNAQIAGHVHDRRLGGAGRASPASTSSAASARTRCSPPARSCCRTCRRTSRWPGYPAKPAAQQRGPAPARLLRRRHARGAPRVQDALSRGPVARRGAARALAAAARDAPALAPLVEFLAEPRPRHRPLSASADARRPPAAAVTIGIVAGEASGRCARGDADPCRARPAARTCDSPASPGRSMEAAGCEAWRPLEKLAVRGFAEVVAHLPELLAHPARARARDCSPRACRCSSASTRPTSTSGSSAS